MHTLESLTTEVDGLRETFRMANSDSVETRQLLKAQTSTVNALRADQLGLRGLMDQQAKILAEQGIGIGDLVIAVNQTQQEIHALRSDLQVMRSDLQVMRIDVLSVKGDVAGLAADVTGLQLGVYELKADTKSLTIDVKRLDERQDRTEERQDRVEQRQDRMDRNIAAIMRHLGVEPSGE
jgi:chromosome segregation ATPase